MMLGADSSKNTMPLMGPIPEGKTFFCPHCGALYSVTDSFTVSSEGLARADVPSFLFGRRIK